MTVARVGAAGLGVAVVEAAAAVVVGAVEYRVHALRLVVYGRATGIVIAVAGTGRDEDAVRLLAIECDGGPDGTCQVVVAVGLWAGEASRRSLSEVIAVAGLVVDDGDEACRVGAEGVLSGGIGDATGRQGPDSRRGVVRTTLDLVESAGKGTEKRSSRAVCSNAGRAARGVEVTWPGGHKGASGHEAKGKSGAKLREHSWFLLLSTAVGIVPRSIGCA